MSLKEPINLERALSFLNQLQISVDRFPYSREKAILRFYLEELKYRFWHHTLPSFCTCTDLDFIEYRYNQNQKEIVGLFEIKNKSSQKDIPRTQAQTEIQIEIAQSLNVPLWLTTFDLKEKYFQVEQLYQTSGTITMTETEYRKFITEL